jgi:hypothetical protein
VKAISEKNLEVAGLYFWNKDGKTDFEYFDPKQHDEILEAYTTNLTQLAKQGKLEGEFRDG